MLKTYKWYIAIGLFLVYTFGVWNVSKKYIEHSHQQEIIETQKQVMETKEARAQLADDIGRAVETGLGKIKITQKTINQKVVNEITKERVYTECITTPDGVQLIESAIGNKGSSSN